MTRSQLSVLALIIASLATAACGADDPQANTPADFVQRALDTAVTDTVVPTIEAFAVRAHVLDEAVQAVCPAPSEQELIDLQDKWIALADAWSAAAVYNLGPLNDDLIAPTMIYVESMRQRGIDYGDTVRESVDLGIAGEQPLDANYFQALQFNRVGLLGLEVLLFEGAAPVRSSTVSDLVVDFQDEPRRCKYLKGISSLLAQRANDVHKGWTQDFEGLGPYADIMRSPELADGSSPIQSLLLSVSAHLEYIEKRKLNGVRDMRIAHAARPQLNLFFSNLDRALQEIQDLVQKSEDGEPAIYNAMAHRGFSSEVARVQVALRLAREAAQRGDRTELADRTIALTDHFREEVPDGLGVDLGLNFSDGD